MTPFWNGFLLVTGIVGLIGVLIFAPFCVFDEVFGTDFVEKLLKKLNIPLNYNKMIIIAIVCFVTMLLSYILRKILLVTMKEVAMGLNIKLLRM